MEYPVRLEWTPCNFGGRRSWFVCPAQSCGRRVAILFGGSIFACRHCHKLAYQCQRETDDDRAMRRADTIRRRLGWEAGIANPEGGKPKGMHWGTFARLKSVHDAFANASWAGMAERLGLMNRRLAGIGLDTLYDLGPDMIRVFHSSGRHRQIELANYNESGEPMNVLSHHDTFAQYLELIEELAKNEKWTQVIEHCESTAGLMGGHSRRLLLLWGEAISKSPAVAEKFAPLEIAKTEHSDDQTLRKELKRFWRLNQCEDQQVAYSEGRFVARYIKLKLPTNKIVITFSTARQGMRSEPFGYPFLSENGYDHLHFAQADNTNFQGLSFEEFKEIAWPFCIGKQVYTYGSSLGGYAAVYYAGAVNAKAIAATPLNPGHPIASPLKEKAPYSHKEAIENPKSDFIPVILYDKNIRSDVQFLERCILSAYPNAILKNIDHCGHGGALVVLKQSGLLKQVVLDLLAGIQVNLDSPEYIEKYKQTPQYLMERARYCVSKGLFEDAANAALHAVKIESSLRGYVILIRCLLRLGDKQKVSRTLEEGIVKFPRLATIFSDIS